MIDPLINYTSYGSNTSNAACKCGVGLAAGLCGTPLPGGRGRTCEVTGKSWANLFQKLGQVGKSWLWIFEQPIFEPKIRSSPDFCLIFQTICWTKKNGSWFWKPMNFCWNYWKSNLGIWNGTDRCFFIVPAFVEVGTKMIPLVFSTSC